MVLSEMTTNQLTIESFTMQPARSQNRWRRLFRPAMLVLSVLALCAVASNSDAVAAVGLAFAVIALGARAMSKTRSQTSDNDLTEAVWPVDTKPRFELSEKRGRRARQARKSVGARLDEIERQFRNGDISDAERLALRDEVITATK